MLLVDGTQKIEVFLPEHPAPYAVVDLHHGADLPAWQPVNAPHDATESSRQFGAFRFVHLAMNPLIQRLGLR